MTAGFMSDRETVLPNDLAGALFPPDPLYPEATFDDPWQEATDYLDGPNGNSSRMVHLRQAWKGEVEGQFNNTGSERKFIRTVGKLPLLTDAQRVELIKQSQDGDGEATETLLATQTALVSFFVNKHYRSALLPREDCVMEGVFGLARTIEKFNPRLGNKFSSYAIWQIRRSIQRAMYNQARVVRIPEPMERKITRVNQAKNNLALEHGEPFSDAEIAAESDLDLAQVRNTQDVEYKFAEILPLEDTEPVAEEGDDLSEIGMMADCRQEIEELLSGLNEEEQTVLRLRFGLDGSQPQALVAVGEHLGVSKETVRQIELRALETLRARNNIESLRDYIE